MDHWPPRRYGWVATYTDGSVLREVYDGPPTTTWGRVERGRLAGLALVNLWPGGEGEVFAVDCETGTFDARGHRVAFELGPILISGRKGPYRDVFQHKEAHTDYQPGTGALETVVDAHVIGYRRQLPELHAKVALRLATATRGLSVQAEFTPRTHLGIAPEDLIVLVDGEPVDGATFRELLAPPGASSLPAAVGVT